ncbi:MAG TPA: DNA-directed RNA polymerase subunit omega, partial [Thermotogota bacterium]|nr:DNA-directed RNA polymerase subunit omega [Thermotogota bacterium]
LKKVPYKYAIPVLVGKRAERLKEERTLRGEHSELSKLMEYSMEEVYGEKVKIRNEDMMKLLKPIVK